MSIAIHAETAREELHLIGAALGESIDNPERYSRLYAAQQALAWALDPDGYCSPLTAIMTDERLPPTGTPAD
jgi:hypothetical protein